jgi:thiol-disulfide isomerase/thioredoxin
MLEKIRNISFKINKRLFSKEGRLGVGGDSVNPKIRNIEDNCGLKSVSQTYCNEYIGEETNNNIVLNKGRFLKLELGSENPNMLHIIKVARPPILIYKSTNKKNSFGSLWCEPCILFDEKTRMYEKDYVDSFSLDYLLEKMDYKEITEGNSNYKDRFDFEKLNESGFSIYVRELGREEDSIILKSHLGKNFLS